jgi:phosphate:Na+ symporter
MKLALFHTIFNVIGVLAVSPFINPLVRYLKTLFHIDVAARGKAKYLTDEVMELPSTALAALRKETIHLYDKSLEAIVHAMNLHRSEIFSDTEISKVVKHSNAQIKIDIDKIYQQDIKNLYSQILHYASLSQSYMDQADNNKIYELKLTARNIIEMVKDVRELQKNLNFYAKSNNNFTIDKYNEIRAQLITVLRKIQRIRDYVVDETAEVDIQTQIELQKEKAKVNESEEKLNQNIASLIRENKINSTMASSLINDVGFSHSICRKFLNSATTLWVKEDEMKELGDEYEY